MSLQSFFKILIALVLLGVPALFYFSKKTDFIEANTLDDVKAHMQELAPGALVVFDVDNVLIVPGEATLHNVNKDFREDNFKILKNKLSEEDYLYLRGIVKLQYTRVLVNPEMPGFIKSLQDRGIKVIALSSMQTGSLGVIADRHALRIKELRDFDIYFGNAFPDYKKHIYLKGVQGFGQGESAGYLEGVICTNNAPKGEALAAFLAEIKFMPSEIVFVDNKLHKLHSVKMACRKLGIPFKGIHYNEAKLKGPVLNEAVANFQFEYLERNRKWLSDKEAEILMLN